MKLFRALVVAASVMLSATPLMAKEFRYLAGWDKTYQFHAYITNPFIEGIEKASGGRIKFSFHGPEAVPPFEQLEPVAKGVFHFLFTHGAYHHGTTPIMTVAEVLEGTPETIHSSGLFDYLDKHYQKLGLKLISIPVTPYGAYHYILKAPMSANGDWAGRKIRGAATHKPVIEMLGGVMVILPPAEIYTALEKGLVDGAVWPAVGVLDYRWYEVAKYLLRPAMGANYEPIFMNLDAWNALSPDDRKIIMTVAREVEESWYKISPVVFKREEDALLAKGVQITEMGPSQKAKLRQTWMNGLWAVGMQANRASTQAVRDFAESKGLIK
jgi:TRAP-type C4-dicarboxylate transport system substrate-binding protein